MQSARRNNTASAAAPWGAAGIHPGWWGGLLAALLLGGCASGPPIEQDSAPKHRVDVSRIPDAVPRPEPRSRYGNPPSYEVFGKRYHVMDSSRGHKERGIASWYGTKFHGRRTSSGEIYDMHAMTAAHKTLPLPTYARVTNLDNGRSVVVRINDRGPFHDGRIIDLSYAAAIRLGIDQAGTGRVEVRALEPESGSVAASAPPSTSSDIQARPGQKLYLQVGAFGDRANAENLRQRLRKEAYGPVKVVPGGDRRNRVYRVRVGPLASVEEADRLTARLAQLGIHRPHLVID